MSQSPATSALDPWRAAIAEHPGWTAREIQDKTGLCAHCRATGWQDGYWPQERLCAVCGGRGKVRTRSAA